MTTIAFDTLKLARRLEAAGFPHAQAADTAAALAESLGKVRDLATKADLAALRTELKSDIAELCSELKRDIAELRAELKGDIAELRAELLGVRAELKGDIAELRAEFRAEMNSHLRWIIGTIVAVAALAVAAVKLLP